MNPFPFGITRDAYGRLVVTDADGTQHVGVTPVRAFPISSPDAGLSLVNEAGREICWIERLDDLPTAEQELLREELAGREFVPEIRRIVAVSGFSCPCTWQVQTDRGATELVLKAEEDIRRLSRTRLLIADAYGVQFLVRDISGLDRQSRRFLDRFL